MRHLLSFRYVQEIAETGSIRAAAERLNISASALNRHIQTLERELDMQLFDRLSRGVRLSAEGELFYQFAARQLMAFNHLESQINDLKGMRSGAVRIGYSQDLELSLLHRMIAEYQSEHPRIRFRLVPVSREELEPAITQNLIDLALFYQPVLTGNIQVMHALEADIHVAMPAGAPFKKSGVMKLYDLLGHPIVLPLPDTELHNRILAACEKQDIQLNVVMECGDPLRHISATHQSRVGLCLPFPDDHARYQKYGYKLVRLKSKDLGQGYISLVTAAHGLIPVAAKRFIETLIQQFETEMPEEIS